MSTRRINDLLNLSTVLHWHSVPTLRKPSVAEHSYRVAVIALEIAQRLNRGVSPSSVIIESHVMRWALMHDGPETETGDLPHTAKVRLPSGVWSKLEAELCPWYMDEVLRLHAPERAIVKIADLMELVLFIREWGHGGEAEMARMATSADLAEVVLAVRARFGWAGLSDIVYDILALADYRSDMRHNKPQPSTGAGMGVMVAVGAGAASSIVGGDKPTEGGKD